MSILDEPSPFALARFWEELRQRGRAKHPVTGMIHISYRWQPGELMDDMGLERPLPPDDDGAAA